MTNAQSVVVAASNGDGDWRLYADDLLEGFRLETNATQIVLFLYDRPLAGLGLSRGAIADEMANGNGACEVTQPVEVFTLADDETSWQPKDAPPEVVSKLRALTPEICDRCVRFEPLSVGLGAGDEDGVLSAAWLRSGAALLGMTSKRLLRVDRAGNLRPVMGCEEMPWTALRREGEKRYWAGSNNGTIALLEIDEDESVCSVLHSASANIPGRVRFIETSKEGEPFELFALETGESKTSTKGTAVRFDGASVQVLFEFDVLDGGEKKGGLARLGPKHVFFAGGGSEIFEWEDGRLSSSVPESSDATVEVLARLADSRIVGVTVTRPFQEIRRLRQYDRESLKWLDLGAIPDSEAQDIGSVVAFRGGLVSSVRSAKFVEHHADLGFCDPPTELFLNNQVARILLGSDDALLAADLEAQTTAEQTPVWLFPKR